MPVAVEPVNMIEVGLVDERRARRAAARRDLEDVRRGMPHSASPSASSSDVSGVNSDGLRMTLLPASSAGIASPNELTSG